MPARRSPVMTIAAPTFSLARSLIASSTLCSGATLMTPRGGLARNSSATVFITDSSHVRIVRTAAAFGRHPLDVLLRILDVAGLAMHAVLSVDPELHPTRIVRQ